MGLDISLKTECSSMDKTVPWVFSMSFLNKDKSNPKKLGYDKKYMTANTTTTNAVINIIFLKRVD